MYGGGGTATRDAALAAARALWSCGESAETCHLIADFDLGSEMDVRAVMRAALDANKGHAAVSLGASRHEYALALLEEHCTRGEAKIAMPDA